MFCSYLRDNRFRLCTDPYGSTSKKHIPEVFCLRDFFKLQAFLRSFWTHSKIILKTFFIILNHSQSFSILFLIIFKLILKLFQSYSQIILIVPIFSNSRTFLGFSGFFQDFSGFLQVFFRLVRPYRTFSQFWVYFSGADTPCFQETWFLGVSSGRLDGFFKHFFDSGCTWQPRSTPQISKSENRTVKNPRSYTSNFLN